MAPDSDEIQALRREMDAKLGALDEKLTLLNQTGWRAIDKFEESVAARLASVNEFRAQLSDQARTFATREALEAIRDRLEMCASEELVNEIRTRIEGLATREALDQTLKTRETRFQAGETRLKEMEDWKNNLEGRQAVRIYLWPILVGVIVFVLTQIARIVFPVLPR